MANIEYKKNGYIELEKIDKIYKQLFYNETSGKMKISQYFKNKETGKYSKPSSIYVSKDELALIYKCFPKQ